MLIYVCDSMYELYRIVNHGVMISDTNERHILELKKQKFIIDDDVFDKLKDISDNKTEYDYDRRGIITNVLFFDRHPHFIEDIVDNDTFMEDYIEGINDKFFVSYYYKEIV